MNKSPQVTKSPNKDDNTGRPKIVSILPRQPRFGERTYSNDSIGSCNRKNMSTNMQHILSYRAVEPPAISSHRLDLVGGL